MLCPNCGHSSRPEAVRCGHCNFKLPEDPRPQAAATVLTTVSCWNCAQATPSTAERCTHCNAKARHDGESATDHRIPFTQLTASHDE